MKGTPSPGLTALGVALILVAIPFGFLLAPLVIGIITLAVGLYRLDRAVAA
jgi:hypothetical protein